MTRLRVTVCVPLTDDPTAAVHAAVGSSGAVHEVEVRYEPDLLAPQRFPADHRGDPAFVRGPAQQERWDGLLSTTDVALGIPGDGPDGLRQLARTAPGLRWVQGTAAGTGEQLLSAGWSADQLARIRVTSAAGLHAEPLTEFALSGLLALLKDHDVLRRASSERQWLPRWPMRQLAGSRVAVLGMGGIGRRLADVLHALGAEVVAVRRRPDAVSDRASETVSRTVGLDDLDALLPQVDAVVSTLPGTPATRGLLDAGRLALLPPHAVVVNVGRGSVVDSAALVAALDAGRLRGAALDVTDVEPLPADSPLWGRPDVVLSPHTAALTAEEDRKIIALFADNLVRFLSGRTMRNLVDPAHGY
ncbi:MAG: D-2-hydroxyacid dehydrogenase [Motilibacteraceae bacterium]